MRKYMPFKMQCISMALQLAAALEIRQALGVGLVPASVNEQLSKCLEAHRRHKQVSV